MVVINMIDLIKVKGLEIDSDIYDKFINIIKESEHSDSVSHICISKYNLDIKNKYKFNEILRKYKHKFIHILDSKNLDYSVSGNVVRLNKRVLIFELPDFNNLDYTSTLVI